MDFIRILSAEQTRDWDKYTTEIQNIKSIDLMERAAVACVDWIRKNIKSTTPIKIFCGSGNNGADGLAIARLLIEKGYIAFIYLISTQTRNSENHSINLYDLKNASNRYIFEITSPNDIVLNSDEVLLDCILGSGLSRPLEGFTAAVVRKINAIKALVIAIDVPTGMETEITETTFDNVIIQATHTLTFQVPKLSFLFPEAFQYTGDVLLLDIGLNEEYNIKAASDLFWLTKKYVKKMLKRRNKFDHKGIYGHALLIAGSYGKMGAAILSSQACLRSGVGLLSVQVPLQGYEIMQLSTPEAMLIMDKENIEYIKSLPDNLKYNAIGIGPGLGTNETTKEALKGFLKQQTLPPLVIDADGINLLSQIMQEDPSFIIPVNTILTPHLKEFDRLVGSCKNNYERHTRQNAFSTKHKVYLILKGAYTCISSPEGKMFFNSTGNPGMAKGGSGDILTGILTGLSAQGYSALETCILGVFLHGIAGDIASEKLGEYAMTSGDIIDHIPNSYNCLIE